MALCLVQDAFSYTPSNGRPHRRAIEYGKAEQIRKRELEHDLLRDHFEARNLPANGSPHRKLPHFGPKDCPMPPPFGCPSNYWPQFPGQKPVPSNCPKVVPIATHCKTFWKNVWEKYWSDKKPWNGKAPQNMKPSSSDYNNQNQQTTPQSVPNSNSQPQVTQPNPQTQSGTQVQTGTQAQTGTQTQPSGQQGNNGTAYPGNGQDWMGQQNPHAFSGTDGEVAKFGFKGKRMSGDMTYFGPGYGACGWPEHDYENVVAVSGQLFQIFGNGITNGNPVCGHQIRIFKNGKTAIASITDECNECAQGSLDMSPTLFKYFVDLQVGRTTVEWEFI
ncbi:uncharacterized protein FA14DRAFT_190001 [Meira miltonrushii]|uniref:RlpA-like protein double-psi beta-barrel domain-containing protein n=1 Tax=Meira miltonrushii TaxID=1280837 RepID=A0A316VKN8_9BASI|nr:uncharacterized protein FA14DRAFT_190001 [Meira miltonrushii]PWN36085.1 hypothetical protein FA14DRAFT_190001 [Meira miltonrushii]